MKTFPILYKRSKTRQIVYWQITVEDPIRPKEHGDYAYIRKTTGQLGTPSPVTHAEAIRSGKQKRSYIEQALFMAESDWKRKRDEGYKSLEDLKIEPSDGIIKSANGVYQFEGKEYSLFNALQLSLPEFNTDSSGNVKPMLATDWKKVKKIEYPVHVQPKFDGVRCLMIVTPATGNVVFLSRSGKEYTSLQHIKNCFSLAVLSKIGDNDFILDGEIYSDELNFQEIVSAVKAYKESSLKLKFRAYDIVNDKVWSERIEILDAIVAKIDSPFIEMTATATVDSEKKVKELHDAMVNQGFEGVMIRTLNGKYGQGQRSRELLKVKEFIEEEFPLIGFEFGQRGVQDLLAIVQLPNGNSCKPTMTGTLTQKEALYNEWNGKARLLPNPLLTVKHFGYTNDGILRHPNGKAIRDYE